MTLFGLALRNLKRRPGRSLFTLLGVMLAVASFLTLIGLSRSLQDGTADSLAERGVDLVVSRQGLVELFGGSLPEDLRGPIERADGVAEVSPELITLLEVDEGVQSIVAGWDPRDFTFREMKLLRGRMPRQGAHEVVVGDELATALKADVGGEIQLNFETFTIVGVADFGSGMLRGMAVLPLRDLQALLGLADRVTLYQVRLEGRDARTLEQATRSLQRVRHDINVAGSDEFLRSNKTIKMLSTASVAIGILAMAMAALSVLNTLAMAVEERVREMGVLASIGWPRGRILLLVLLEGVILACLGAAAGLVVGQIALISLDQLLLPGSGLSIRTNATIAVEALLAAVIVGALGGLGPALHASRLTPAAALRRQ